jgi:catechol 2,3-dioxygenase-like lactoylglutathione lyase family enzyme
MTTIVKLTSAIPALPSRSVQTSVAFYRDRLGFEVYHHHSGFAVLGRDEAVLNLWEAVDESWQERTDWSKPVCSGAETFIAGTASCRFQAENVAELYPSCRDAGIVHPNARLEDTDFGTTEFGILDPDGNLVTFFEWR